MIHMLDNYQFLSLLKSSIGDVISFDGGFSYLAMTSKLRKMLKKVTEVSVGLEGLD